MLNQLQEVSKDESNSTFTTNVVLKEEKKKKITYYLPCYVRFKVKELLSVDIDGLTAQVSGTLLFSFNYGKMEEEILQQFVGGDKAILLQFSRQQSLQLSEDKGISIKRDEKEKNIDFTVRQDFTCYIVGDVFFTPFEIVNLYLTITIQTVHLEPLEKGGKKIDVKFNCMTHKDAMLINHGQKCDHGLFSLANNFLSVKYTNIDKNPYKNISVFDNEEEENPSGSKVDDAGQDLLNSTKKLFASKNGEDESPQKINKVQMEDRKIKHFQYAHMRIPLYKHPGVNLFEIFIPLWILGIINLFVFFQQNILADKMATIATITLAYVAFIPTINATVPNTPQIKLIDVLVYVNILTTIFTMIDSVITVRTKPVDYVFEWQSNGWFWTTAVLNSINVLIICILFCVHKCFWERIYTSDENTKKKKKSLTRKIWYNKECDSQFEQDIKLKKITVV